MKILYIYDKFPHPFAPAFEQQARLVSQVSNIDLTIHCSLNSKEYQTFCPTIEFSQFGDLGSRLINSFKRIFFDGSVKLTVYERYLLQQDFDIIHLHQSYLIKRIYNLIQMEKIPNIILTFNGGDTYIKPLISPRWRELLHFVSDKVNLFQVFSNHQKQSLNRLGIHQEKIFVSPRGVNTEFFYQKRIEFKSEIRICSLFRFVWEKSIDFNLLAIKEIVKSGYKVRYSIFGDGPSEGQLYFWIKKLKLEDIVSVNSTISHDQLTFVLNGFDFILQLSSSESLGASVIEAQSKGIPAIVSDSGGLPETVKNNESGFVIPFPDYRLASQKIIEIWEDKDRYELFSNNATEFAKSFYDQKHIVKELMKTYNSLFDSVRL